MREMEAIAVGATARREGNKEHEAVGSCSKHLDLSQLYVGQRVGNDIGSQTVKGRICYY